MVQELCTEELFYWHAAFLKDQILLQQNTIMALWLTVLQIARYLPPLFWVLYEYLLSCLIFPTVQCSIYCYYFHCTTDETKTLKVIFLNNTHLVTRGAGIHIQTLRHLCRLYLLNVPWII
jgi:hypothetical protein